MAIASNISVTVLERRYTDKLSYYDDWLDAVRCHPGFDVKICNIATIEGKSLARSLIVCCDVVLAMHSTTSDGVSDLEDILPILLDRKCLFAVFVGNEVNLPAAPMAGKLRFLRDSRVDLVISQLLQEAADWYYSPLEFCQAISLPHALNPKSYTPGPKHASRFVDIGARSHRYPPHLGDRDRVNLFEFFTQNSGSLGLKIDVELGGERFDRNGWAGFLKGARATLASEAGSSFLDRDDSLVAKVQSELLKEVSGKIVLKQNSIFREIVRKIAPEKFKKITREILGSVIIEDYNISSDVDSEKERIIVDRIFRNKNKPPFHTKAISSRHFDAIGCNTAQVMYLGRYNDILYSGENYIEIERDFSNIDDVKMKLNDHSYLDKMTTLTREYVSECHTHAHRMTALELKIRDIASGAR
tara:strand:+ start:1781 stop:3025 length:1245 start_codon:yes stop_codon:yes gene_type:complete